MRPQDEDIHHRTGEYRPRGAPQSRVALSIKASSTGFRSKVERLMTLSTSAVAVCCCSDSRSSLSSRVFSMAMTAWAAKFVDQLDLLIGERAHLLAVDTDHADQLVLLEHRNDKKGSDSTSFRTGDHERIAIYIGFQVPDVVNMHGLFSADNSCETGPGSWSNRASLEKLLKA